MQDIQKGMNRNEPAYADLCRIVFIGAEQAALDLSHNSSHRSIKHRLHLSRSYRKFLISEFLNNWSLLDVLGMGWLGPVEMMLWFAQEDLFTAELRLNWWGDLSLIRKRLRTLTVMGAPTTLAAEAWRGVTSHLLDSIGTKEWRSGHVFAAQQHLKDLLKLKPELKFRSEPMAYVWALFRYVGGLGVKSKSPEPLACGTS